MTDEVEDQLKLAADRLAEGSDGEAVTILNRIIGTDPANLSARIGLFEIALGHRRLAEALAHLRALPEPARSEFQTLAHEADLLGKLGDHEGEISLLRQLMEMRPDVASLWVSMASAQKTLGRTDEAIATLRQAIAIQPTYGKPWWLLADLKRFRFGDDDMAEMQRLLGAATSVPDVIALRFALAKGHEDRREWETAFGHYAEGNRLRSATMDRRGRSVTVQVDRSIALYTREFLDQREGLGAASSAPIFIVGVPRSGSTLIEQILASHPLVEGTSELPLIPEIERRVRRGEGPADGGNPFDRIAELDGPQLAALGNEYLERASAFRLTDRPLFIDKLPANWISIGFIRLILPNARIIDARRHPLAVGLSNFKQNYGAGGAFTDAFATIARYYRDYLRLVSHFERVDRGAVYRITNESLIENFEAQVRRLLDHLGLPFDPACLDFHLNPRAVATPSAEQVRRPINRDGVDHWRSFEPWLGELERALGPALEGWNLAPGAYRDDQG